jgi:hypothetical protein
LEKVIKRIKEGENLAPIYSGIGSFVVVLSFGGSAAFAGCYHSTTISMSYGVVQYSIPLGVHGFVSSVDYGSNIRATVTGMSSLRETEE